MQDKIITATAANNSISIVFCILSNTCNEAIKLHNLKGTAAEALSEGLIAGALVGTTLKNDNDSVTLTIQGNGPAQGMVVRANNDGTVRGYLYNKEATADTVPKLFGNGVFKISKDIGLREPYIGQLPLLQDDIAENVTAYFTESEQITSACGIDVDFNSDDALSAAGGFLIQLLPNTPLDITNQLEEDLEKHPLPANLITKYNGDVKEILKSLLPSFDITILEETPITWQCICSRDKMVQLLISIGRDELEKIVKDGQTTEIICDYCGKHYYFEPDEIDEIYKGVK